MAKSHYTTLGKLACAGLRLRAKGWVGCLNFNDVPAHAHSQINV